MFDHGWYALQAHASKSMPSVRKYAEVTKPLLGHNRKLVTVLDFMFGEGWHRVGPIMGPLNSVEHHPSFQG